MPRQLVDADEKTYEETHNHNFQREKLPGFLFSYLLRKLFSLHAPEAISPLLDVFLLSYTTRNMYATPPDKPNVNFLIRF